MSDSHETLEHALGHRFEDPELLSCALTHRSYRNEHPNVNADNERLEFLGDAALGLFVAKMVFEQHPGAGEGQLTRLRAELVCEDGLRQVADALALGEALRLGKGEERSGGRSKSRLLCSALEAVVGAVLQDGGTEAVERLVHHLFEERIGQATAKRDAKSELQELVQRVRGATPTYNLLEAVGPDHARSFRVAVQVEGETLAEGEGRSKAKAQQQAAQGALESLRQDVVRAEEAS